MKIERVEVKAYRVKVVCDCGGDFVYSGRMLPTEPPLYKCYCISCGIQKSLNDKPGSIQYEEVNSGD